MERKDKFVAILSAVLSGAAGYYFALDYEKIAESGITLASIVLAVYMAAIVGLINTELAKKMQVALAGKNKDMTQLGMLTKYFWKASLVAIGTIVVSSIIIIVPMSAAPTCIENALRGILSIGGLILYTENLVFLWMIIRFMLNRQIWNR